MFVHAHPDDEALLTAGTMRALHEAGHAVFLVVATDGAEGLTSSRLVGQLSDVRARELEVSAEVLGVRQTHWLGYSDSGLDGSAPGNSLVSAPREESAERLARILAQVAADVVVGYDRHGGYGHPDHVRVHELTRLAAERAGTKVVLEATIDRQVVVGVVDRLRRVAGRLPLAPVWQLAEGFTARADIGYCVDVRRWTAVKRAALKAHSSQQQGGAAPRTITLLLALPRPLFRRVAGREWFGVVREDGPNPIADLPRA